MGFLRDFRSLLKHTSTPELLLNLVGLLGAIGAGAVTPLMTIFFGEVTTLVIVHDHKDEQAKGESQGKTNLQIVNLLYLAIAAFFTTYAFVSIFVWTGETITNRIRSKAMKSLLSQEVSYYEDGSATRLASELQNDLDAIQTGISDKVPNNVQFLATAATGFIIAIIKSWKLGLAVLSMWPALLIIGTIMGKYGIGYIMQVMGALAPVSGISQEALGGVTTIRSLGAERSILDKVHTIQEKALKTARTKNLIWAGCMGGMTFVIYGGYALCFGYGGQLLRNLQIDAGSLITIFLSVMMGSFAFGQIPANLHAFMSALEAVGKLDAIIEREPEIMSPPNALKLNELRRGMEFNDVSFAYPTRPDTLVLKNVTFRIAAGETVALVGHSGSGKSTLASLLLSFHRPKSGIVSYDSNDLKDLDLAHLRGTLVASVLQEPQLFSYTIFENIALGLAPEHRDLPLSDQRSIVENAARLAQADEFIRALPKGYDTATGEGGVQLSGGQKARIAIARALIRRAPVLILDEATANLDTMSERALHAALDQSCEGRTTVVIAHRLSTVRKADRIIVMHDGRVLTQGTHDELMQVEDGPYRKLFEAELQVTQVEQSHAAVDKGKEEEQGADVTDDDASTIKGNEYNDDDKYLEVDEEKKGLIGTFTSMARQSFSSLRSDSRTLVDAGKYSLDGLAPGVVADPKAWKSIKILCSVAKSEVVMIALGVAGSLLAGLLYPAFANIYALALGAFGTHPFDRRVHDLNALLCLACGIFGFLTTAAQWYCLGFASDRIACALRSAMLKRVLYAPMGFFDAERNQSAALGTIVNNSPSAVANFVGTAMGTFIASVATLVGGCIVGLCYSWKLGLVNMSVLPLTLGTGIIRLRVIVAREDKCKVFHEPANRVAIAAVSQLQTVASLAAEPIIFKEYESKLEESRKRLWGMAFVNSSLFALAQTNMYFVIALGFWYGSKLVFGNEISPRDFFAVHTAIVAGSFQAVNVLTQAPELSQARNAALDIGRLLVQPIEKRTGYLPAVPGDLALHDTTFKYPSREEPSLREVSLAAKLNSFTAICGPSGSGKSTVIRLVQRLYQPDSGSLTLGNVNINAITEELYREHVALVAQEPVLFNMTIRENLLLGLPCSRPEFLPSGSEELLEALGTVNLRDFVKDLPDGIETELGARGVALSGGQRQRLVIARALLRRPSLLLLDEATSALDHANQAAVQAALENIAKTRALTIVSVAHRLSTIAAADNIYVLNNGRLIEQGTYPALVAQGGLFASLALTPDE